MATYYARYLSLIKKKSNFIYYLLTAKAASWTLWGAVDDGLTLLKSETRTSCFKRSINRGFILGLKITKESISQFLDITITERLICTWIKKWKRKEEEKLLKRLGNFCTLQFLKKMGKQSFYPIIINISQSSTQNSKKV